MKKLFFAMLLMLGMSASAQTFDFSCNPGASRNTQLGNLENGDQLFILGVLSDPLEEFQVTSGTNLVGNIYHNLGITLSLQIVRNTGYVHLTHGTNVITNTLTASSTVNNLREVVDPYITNSDVYQNASVFQRLSGVIEHVNNGWRVENNLDVPVYVTSLIQQILEPGEIIFTGQSISTIRLDSFTGEIIYQE